MIQRKQTIFLLLALILIILCLCMPIALFVQQTMGMPTSMYNLWMVDANGAHSFTPWPLFAILLFTSPISLAAIFTYKNRKLQARLCVFVVLLLLAWYAAYAYFVLTANAGAFRPMWAAACPLVAIILCLMARHAILADEALVRAADRIR